MLAGGVAVPRPPTLPAAPRRARKGCQPFVQLRRLLGSGSTLGSRGEGRVASARGLRAVVGDVGWGGPAPWRAGVGAQCLHLPSPQGHMHCLHGCVHCLQWRWQRCLLFWLAWKAAWAAVAWGGPTSQVQGRGVQPDALGWEELKPPGAAMCSRSRLSTHQSSRLPGGLCKDCMYLFPPLPCGLWVSHRL